MNLFRNETISLLVQNEKLSFGCFCLKTKIFLGKLCIVQCFK